MKKTTEEVRIDYLNTSTFIPGKTMPMGFPKDHPANNPNWAWPRTFRFMFHPEYKPKMSHFMKKVSFDYVGKMISFEIYETPNDEIFDYLSNLKTNPSNFILTYLDGCGRLLSSTTFTNVVLISHSSDVDYSSSEIITNKVVVTYDSASRNAHLEKL